MTVEHLDDALESLEAAREEAELGTGMMISGVIEDLRELRNRTEKND